VPPQRVGETGEWKVELEPPSEVPFPEDTSAFIEPAVKTVQPWLPDLAVKSVVGFLVVDGGMFLDGLERYTEILGPVSEGQEIAESSVNLRVQVFAAAIGGVVAQRYELPEKGGVGLEGCVGVDRHHKDLARRIADHAIEIECKDMHGGEV